MIPERNPQETAANLEFETSDNELRRLLHHATKVSTGQKQMSEGILEVLRDFDIPITADTKKAAGASFLFTYGLARSAALAEVKAELGVE